MLPTVAAEVEPNWPAGEPNIRKNTWDGFIDFEDGIDGEAIQSNIPGLEFTTTMGLDWIYGDIRTGKYNAYPYGSQEYEINGNFCAWLGVSGDHGKISFPEGEATYLSGLVSTGSGVIMDAYDSNDNFLATSGWANSNVNTRTLTRLTVEAPGMAYVIIHDTGNYWIIDDIVTDAPGVPSAHYEAAELTKTLFGAPYLWGGKGWDYTAKKFAEPGAIIETGYTYYNYNKGSMDFGNGIDCSGLILWAYNNAYGSTSHIGEGNPIRVEGADGQHNINFGNEITKDELEPGDVLFFDAYKDSNRGIYSAAGQDEHIDHVAMYVGAFTYENAEYNVVESRGGEGVKATTVDDIINRIEGWAGEDAFVGYHRLVEPKIDMDVSSYCPVDIIITDPDGIMITKDIYEVPGIFYYSEWDIDGDGDLDDRIILPERKTGNYRIEVIAEPGADPTETYTLEVSIGDSTLVLAKDIPISEIPNLPYMIESTETGIIQIIPVAIDFDPDTLNLKSKGRWITTYLELPEDYDVINIDVSTMMLNNQVQAEDKQTEIGDYDNDGIADLMVKFDRSNVEEILNVGNEVEITITGNLTDGSSFEGIDIIKVIE